MMAAKIGSSRKAILYRALRERDGDNCHWCGEPIDFETREGPFSVSLEHLVEKANGGTNEQSNLRLAHSHCNNYRSNPPRAPRRAHLPFHAPKHWRAYA
jgi:5-methylcytosine-specific restriction endonuclease McrA